MNFRISKKTIQVLVIGIIIISIISYVLYWYLVGSYYNNSDESYDGFDITEINYDERFVRIWVTYGNTAKEILYYYDKDGSYFESLDRHGFYKISIAYVGSTASKITLYKQGESIKEILIQWNNQSYN